MKRKKEKGKERNKTTAHAPLRIVEIINKMER